MHIVTLPPFFDLRQYRSSAFGQNNGGDIKFAFCFFFFFGARAQRGPGLQLRRRRGGKSFRESINYAALAERRNSYRQRPLQISTQYI